MSEARSAKVPALTVVGSVNLDLVASAARLPVPGETVTGATFARHPGGKGANQALAAQRLGAAVRLVARVGADPNADEALALLRAGGVTLQEVVTDTDAATGVALIVVAGDGENQIVVAPGANARLSPQDLPVFTADEAVLCQLEVPVPTLVAVSERVRGFLALNLAPARELPPALLARADLLVVNEGEAAFYGPALHAARGHVAVTLGARGAVLYFAGREVARALPPAVNVVDTTGAGDTFTAALLVAWLEGQAPGAALRFACAAGALAATRAGAQPALPSRVAVDALAGEA